MPIIVAIGQDVPPNPFIHNGSIAEASAGFLKDAVSGRRLGESTLRKYKLLLRQLTEFDLFAFPSNKLWLACAVQARAAALRTLTVHGGELMDYLANRCVQAWASLLVTDTQSTLARSVIEGLGDFTAG